MKKITLSLFDTLQLESEINGFQNPQTKEPIFKGFINHNLPIILKFDLFDLIEDLKNQKKKVDDLRNDLVKKYGDLDKEGNYTIKMYDEIDGKQDTTKLCDKFINFENEYNELLSQNIEITYPKITREDLIKIGDTTDNYRFLFKIISKTEEPI